MHIKVIRVLDAANELIQLILEIFSAFWRHHEVVLKDNGHTLSHHVSREGSLGLCERARCRLVRHA